MTEKKFAFKNFEISKTKKFLNEVKLYEIDINRSDDLDESNLFYVYSDSKDNIIQIVNKLNELHEENEVLKQQNRELTQQNREFRGELQDKKRLEKEIDPLRDLILHMGYTIKNENGIISLEWKG